MKVAVLVPRRCDGGRRDELWAWVKARHVDLYPDWPIYEGHHTDGRFNRAKAINDAARAAGPWDAAIVMDADSFVPEAAPVDALRLAEATGACVYAHDEYHGLSFEDSEAVMAGERDPEGCKPAFFARKTCSSYQVVPRALWDAIGGFDEGFEGWGGEDVAFYYAAYTFGAVAEVRGPMFHLWHEPAWDAGHGHDKPNVDRMLRYQACIGKRERMAAIRAS